MNFSIDFTSITIQSKHYYYHWRLEASLAPGGVVLGLDHTDGVIGPALEHVAHRNHGVLLRVILEDVVMYFIHIIIATCNVHLCYLILCMLSNV